MQYNKALRHNGGNVSNALKSSKLARKTACRHNSVDSEFADAWHNAMEEAFDEIYGEARNRAIIGELKKITRKNGDVIEYNKKSDSILVHLLKHAEGSKRCRNRLIKVGNLALDTIKISGEKPNLRAEIIKEMQNDMIESFKQIKLT